MPRTLFCFLFALSSFGAAYSQNYFLNGNAVALGGDCYRLTTELPTQNGTVWYGDQLNLLEPFDLQFTMNFGTIDANGADGICFVLQTEGTSAIGQSGGGMGYLGFGTSLGIEFDTWQNGEYGDPFFDHIAIERDGFINHNFTTNIAGPIQMDPFEPNVEDGQEHTVQIIWNPETQEVSVYFDCVFRLVGEIDLINSIFNGQNLVYFGFTAATGGAFNNQSVCLQENIVSIGESTTICPGTSVQLSAGSSLNGEYVWTPTTFLDDATAATPVANPPVSTTYTVTFTDLCGNTVNDTIEVLVEELEVAITPSNNLSCATPDAVLASVSNFNELTYEWSTADGTINGSITAPSVSVGAAGEYTLITSYQDQCFDTTSFTIAADYSDFAVNGSVNGIINCLNSSVTINTAANLPVQLYDWSTVNGTIAGATFSPQVVVTAPGTYTLLAVNSEECFETIVFDVTADFTVPEIAIGSNATINCAQPEALLQASSSSPLVEWTSPTGSFTGNAQSTSITAVSEGLFIFSATQASSGCELSDTLEVFSDFELPLISIETPDSLTCLQPQVTIDEVAVVANAEVSYTWEGFFEGTIDNANTPNPTVYQADVYTLLVQNLGNGCVSEASIAVSESDNFDFDFRLLSFPNILSANGDVLNAEWRPFLPSRSGADITDLFLTYDVKIVDRWGMLVYETTNPKEHWTPSNEEGVYYYTFKFTSGCGNGATGEHSGYVHVVK